MRKFVEPIMFQDYLLIVALVPQKDGGVVDSDLLVYGTKNVRVV